MTTWKDMINDQLTTITHIEERLSLNEREKKMMHTIIKRHPMCITSYYFDLIDPKDPKDPIRRLAIPNEDELDQHGTYDTSGEEDNTIMQGVQHKYKPTALVLSTNVCFTYCRFCFRKRMVGYTDDEINRRFKETIHYLKTHDEISNVLISGGDSLALSNHMIEQYLKGSVARQTFKEQVMKESYRTTSAVKTNKN